MKHIFKSTNDPENPGEKVIGLKDALVFAGLVFLILSGVVAVFTLIWTQWMAFRIAVTVFVTAVMFVSVVMAYFPEDRLDDEGDGA